MKAGFHNHIIDKISEGCIQIVYSCLGALILSGHCAFYIYLLNHLTGKRGISLKTLIKVFLTKDLKIA